MTANVFEESTLTLSAWVARGSGDRASAKFEFDQKGGTEDVEAQELELGEKSAGKKKVSTKVTLPKCADDEEFYTLKYKVTCGDKAVPGSADFKVWPRTANFKAVDAEGEALEDVTLECNHKPGLVLKTDENGEVALPLNATAPSEVTVRSPCSLLEWVTEKGRAREAKVEKLSYLASIDSHADDTEESKPHKQYVNLESDKTDITKGSKIKVLVGGRIDSECMPGLEGDTIYIKVEFHKDNSKRNDPAPSLIIGGTETKPNKDGVAEGTVKYDAKGGCEFEVELGQAGGDKTKIMVGITKACEDATVYVENWRKLWYQLTMPETATAPSLDRIADALSEVFVEYEQEGDTVMIKETDNAPAGLSWIDGTWVKSKNKKALTIGSYNRGHYHKKFKGVNRPLSIHVLCCDAQYDKGSSTDFFKLPVTATSKVTWSDKSKVVGLVKKVKKGMFPKALHDGKHPFRSGEWRATEGGTDKGALAEADVFAEKGKFTVKLPTAAVEFLEKDPTKNKIEIDVSMWIAAGPFLGESAKYKQLIVVNQDSDGLNDTLTHELGHSVRQVPHPKGRYKKPPGLEKVKHGREYVGNKHQGGHCADGMSDDNYADGEGKKSSDYHKNFRRKKECTCVMYGAGNSACTGKFCDRCKPFVQGQNMKTVEA